MKDKYWFEEFGDCHPKGKDIMKAVVHDRTQCMDVFDFNGELMLHGVSMAQIQRHPLVESTGRELFKVRRLVPRDEGLKAADNLINEIKRNGAGSLN